MTPIRSLAPGTYARLLQVGGARPFRRRLMEMGLLPGTRVRLVRRVDVGNLLELEVRGCHVSVRHSEAKHIHVEPELDLRTAQGA